MRAEHDDGTAGASDGAVMAEASVALGMRMDLMVFKLNCPTCGAMLDLAQLHGAEDECEGPMPLDDSAPLIVRPVVCPTCGKPVVFG